MKKLGIVILAMLVVRSLPAQVNQCAQCMAGCEQQLSVFQAAFLQTINSFLTLPLQAQRANFQTYFYQALSSNPFSTMVIPTFNFCAAQLHCVTSPNVTRASVAACFEQCSHNALMRVCETYCATTGCEGGPCPDCV